MKTGIFHNLNKSALGTQVKFTSKITPGLYSKLQGGSYALINTIQFVWLDTADAKSEGLSCLKPTKCRLQFAINFFCKISTTLLYSANNLLNWKLFDRNSCFFVRQSPIHGREGLYSKASISHTTAITKLNIVTVRREAAIIRSQILPQHM